MNKTYVIAWKSKIGAVARQGKKLFSREEAEQVAAELNEEHPDFVHEAFNLFQSGPLDETLPGDLETARHPSDTAIIHNVEFAPASSFNLAVKEAAIA